MTSFSEEPAAWMAQLRPGHPRLLFNASQWPEIVQRANGDLKPHFTALQEKVAALPETPDTRDWGSEALAMAFVGRVKEDAGLKQRAVALLKASLDFYERQYAEGKAVHWYSFSRIDWLVALDCLWDDLPKKERLELARRMMAHVSAIPAFSSKIAGETSSGPTRGFYGPQSIEWFAGLLFSGEGIDEEKAATMLKSGRAGYEEMLANRAAVAGPQGGSLTGTMNYSMATYPLAEWHYFHSARAALGEEPEKQWTYPAFLARYLDWNWLPGGLEFGYGDSGHMTNRIWGDFLHLHMREIIHFYKDLKPEAAAVAAQMDRKIEEAGVGGVPNKFAQGFPLNRSAVIFPYLLKGNGEPEAKASKAKGGLEAEFFEKMGQVFIRTGTSPEDTYLLISCDGVLGGQNHRHYDAGHFTLYHRGFLALDSGTRLGQGTHLQNYYGQSVAHNTLLIDMPDEEPALYWYRRPERQFGGQYRFTGSKVTSFVRHDDWVAVTCDLTPVYRREKSRRVNRQFVFLKPDTLVIYDRVDSTRAEYGKRWLLHTANAPKKEGRQFSVAQGEGGLVVTTLLPEDARLEAVGGKGKEFMVGDKNCTIPKKELPDGRVTEAMGRWRMEVQPGAPRMEDRFLHLLEVGGKERRSTAQPSVKETPEGVELSLKVNNRSVVLKFAGSGEPGGSISFDGGAEIPFVEEKPANPSPMIKKIDPGFAIRELQRPYTLKDLDADGIPPLLAGIENREAWEKKRAVIEKVWRDYVGRLPERPPVTYKELSETKLPGHVRKKIVFNTVDGDSVSAYLLIPDEALKDKQPRPAILALQPTNAQGKDSIATPEGKRNRMYALELVQRGYIVLAPDAMTSGERIFPGCEQFDSRPFYAQHPEWSTVGKNLTDHMQALDLLCSLPGVDPERIGTIGHSFGAYNAYFLAGVDRRVKAVVSSCGVAPFSRSAYPDHWGQRSFPYTHLPKVTADLARGEVPFEFNEIIALAAPCPMFLYAAQRDAIFRSWVSTAECFFDVGSLYDFLGAKESLVTYIGGGGHDFPPEVRKASYEFLDDVLHFKGSGGGRPVGIFYRVKENPFGVVR